MTQIMKIFKKGFLIVLLAFLVLVGCSKVKITFVGLENVETEYQVGAELPDLSKIVTAKTNTDAEVELSFDYSGVNMNEVGEYEIIITATTTGATATQKIQIKVVESGNPVISGTKDWIIEPGTNLPDLMAGVTAYDPIEGDITDKIEIQGLDKVDVNTPGTYNITYFVETTRGIIAFESVKIIIIDNEAYTGKLLRIDPLNRRFLVEGVGYLNYTLTTKYYQIIDGEVKEITFDDIVLGLDNVYYFINPEKPGIVEYAVIDGNYSYENIRVRINKSVSVSGDNDTYHSSIRLLSSDNIILKNVDHSKSYEVAKNQEILVTIDSQKNVEVKVGSTVVMKDATLITFNPKNNGLIQVLSISRGSSRLYPGRLEVSPAGNLLLLVNDVPLEEYLKYVVPSEMPSSFGLEALKAQAVAARTYAVNDIHAKGYISDGYHVDDSVMSQVYNNTNPNANSNNAILATKGIVATHNGKFIRANFYSTGSGATANSHEVWFDGDTPGEPVPYLTSRVYAKDFNGNVLQFDINDENSMLSYFKLIDFDSPDRSSEYHRWKTEFNISQLKTALQESLSSRYSAKPTQVLTKSGDEFKSLPIPSDIGNIVDINAKQRGGGGLIICLEIKTTTHTFNIYGEYNIRMLFRNITLYCSNINYPQYNSPKSFSLLPSGFFAIEKVGNTIIFYGGGWGHGVGMSQYGARELGKYLSYDAILKFYYTDIELTNVDKYSQETRIEDYEVIKQLIENYLS